MPMEAVWVAVIGQAGAIAAIFVTYLLQKRRITNGLTTTQNKIHDDIRDEIIPKLEAVAEWREGYRGTIWADKEAIDTWVAGNDQRHAQTAAEVEAVKEALQRHDEWERGVKYGQSLDSEGD